MRTIGPKWNASYCGAGVCDICGVRYPMDELAKNGDGFWCCPDDLPGRTRMELSDELAAAARDIDRRELDEEMAQFDAGAD